MNNKKCFFIMPFQPQLNYFYLYLKTYLNEKFNIECERADNKVLTIPLLEKIKDQILTSDVIIADISGRNPNVYYELGIAHSYGKKVILITGDSISDVPSDIRHYEFIKYDLHNNIDFLSKLSNAFQNIFVDHYKILFDKAINFIKQFNHDSTLTFESIDFDSFNLKLLQIEKTQDISIEDSDETLKSILLPIIIKNSTQISIMKKILEWLNC